MTCAAANGGLFIVSAPSGAGKTSLTRALVERGAAMRREVRISVSYTTRAPRPGEVDGVHYHFVSSERFAQMVDADEFLEHAEVFGRRYGTGRAATQALLDAGCDVILDIDWQGARLIRAQRDDAIGIFILPPSLDELERRLRGRGQDDETTIRARMAAAQAEIVHYSEYDYVLVNDDFEQALGELQTLLAARRLSLASRRAALAPLVRALLAK